MDGAVEVEILWCVWAVLLPSEYSVLTSVRVAVGAG